MTDPAAIDSFVVADDVPNANENGTAHVGSTSKMISTTVKSKDNKFHRITFQPETRKIEITLLSANSQPTPHQLVVGLEEVLTVRSERRVRLSSKLPTKRSTRCVQSNETVSENVLLIYYVFRRNIYLWRVREAYIYFNTSSERKQWEQILKESLIGMPERPRKLLVFINPFGGKRKAQYIYDNQVRPLFDMADIECQVVPTERANHAFDFIGEIDTETWQTIDGIISVGGDGLFNEILCSTVLRTQIEHNKDITDGQVDSLATPRMRFGIIGAGSANSIVSSVHGVDDCPTAAIHIAIGSKCAVDVCTVHADNTLLRISANAISYGWLGDVLRDSERYRCMGPVRYQWSGMGFRLFSHKASF
jgi:ceramide kinase